MLAEIQLQGILSFGLDSPTIPLGPLNVLIGTNGSGKSNLVAALALLSALPQRDGLAETLAVAGAREWLWKGGSMRHERVGTLRAVARTEARGGQAAYSLEHTLSFSTNGWGTGTIRRESVLEAWIDEPRGPGAAPRSYLERNLGERGRLSQPGGPGGEGPADTIDIDLDPARSALTLSPQSVLPPALQALANQYREIGLYRAWSFVPGAPARRVCPRDLPHKQLSPDANNLALVLEDLLITRGRARLFKALGRLSAHLEGVAIRAQGDGAQVVVRDRGGWYTPASALSEGTMQLLCLCAVLAHPTPPPLVVIESPEQGLHHEMMPLVAELLKDCAKRAQVLITTHSDHLVEAIAEPGALLVSRQDAEGSTTIRRLDVEAMAPLLGEYSLGQLWRSGELGGVRG